MIMKRTRKALLGFVAAFVFCFALAGTAWAALSDSDVTFSQVGNDVQVTLNGTGSDVSTFSLALDVDVNADDEDAVRLGFAFSEYINSNTKVHEATFKTVGDKTRITLYVAGGHDLFAQPLDVGRITLNLDTAKSSGAEVTVEVPATEEVDPDDPNDAGRESFYALRTVTGARSMDEGAVSQQEPFTVLLGDRRTEPTPPPDNNDPDQPIIQDPDNDDPYMGPDDGLGPKDNPQPGSGDVRGGLGQTGDSQFIVVGVLLVVAAVALCAMGIFMFKRKHKS